MHNALLIAVLAGLGGMIGWGSADFFAKKTIDRMGAVKSLVWAHCFGTGLFILIYLMQSLLGRGPNLPATAGTWLGLIFFGVLQMVVYWLLYQAFEKGQLAVLNPIFASFTGIVALISVMFLGESLNATLAVALATIFTGIILLNLDIQGLQSPKLKIVPGLREVVGATVLAAVWTLGWDKFVTGHDALSYAMFMYGFMTLAAVGLASLLKVHLSKVSPELWKFVFLMGLGETTAYLAISWGYSATSLTSMVALISGAFSVPTVVLAYIFLKERISRLQVFAVGLTILGIVLVALK